MKKIIIALTTMILIGCSKEAPTPVDPRDIYVGKYSGTLLLKSNDGSVNNNVPSSWTISKKDPGLNILIGTDSFYGTIQNGNVSVQQGVIQQNNNDIIQTLFLGPGTISLSNNTLTVDLYYRFTQGNQYLEGNLTGSIIKQ